MIQCSYILRINTQGINIFNGQKCTLSKSKGQTNTLWFEAECLLGDGIGVIHKPRGHIFGIFDPVPLCGHIYQIKLMLQNGHLANPPPPSTAHVVYECPHSRILVIVECFAHV